MNLVKMLVVGLMTLTQNIDTKLPAPLYYLREGQIWRMSKDCQLQTQITHETADIKWFDVSPVQSTLVYISNNSLILSDPDGESRNVLLKGQDLPSIDNLLQAMNDRRLIEMRIASPVWSPDGQRIAYIHNGLNVIDVATRSIVREHPNETISESGSPANRLVITSLLSWSPDARHLAVMTYRYPLTSRYQQHLSLKTIAGPLTELAEGNIFTSAWKPDSSEFLFANAQAGGNCSLACHNLMTGQSRCLGEDIPARRAFFYSYPVYSTTGDILVFVGQSDSPANTPITFNLSRIRHDGYGRVTLQQDCIEIQSALWAADGSGAIVITESPAGAHSSNTAGWLAADGRSIVPIPIVGATLCRWGL